MRADSRSDLEGQAGLGGFMDKLQCKRIFRNYYALELERMDAQKDWRQIKALPPVSNHPMDLDYTG
jgi:hypothetical protein